MRILVIIIVLFSAVTAFGQLPGDLNCDGNIMGSDFTYFFGLWSDYCSRLMECTIENGDMDGDGLPLTSSDYYYFFYFFGSQPPYYPCHPESDTLMIESAQASPGENLILPVYLRTIDTLTNAQFCITADNDYIVIDTVEFALDLVSFQCNCDGNYQVMTFDGNYSFTLLPGEYLLAYVYASVNPDITQPVTTYIEFTEYLDYALYTGLGNMSFFEPILVDAEITITPTGIDDYTDTGLPSKTSITAYPNPFNSSVNITAISDCESELVIYDLLGREIRRFQIHIGNNNIIWDGFDENGLEVRSGLYFVRINNPFENNVKKILLLK